VQFLESPFYWILTARLTHLCQLHL